MKHSERFSLCLLILSPSLLSPPCLCLSIQPFKAVCHLVLLQLKGRFFQTLLPVACAWEIVGFLYVYKNV